jgi:hypothetical protein
VLYSFTFLYYLHAERKTMVVELEDDGTAVAE